jgi:uncharacterized protein (DUF488 family)
LDIYTIGFTQKPAAQFFSALKTHGIRRLIDVRLNNTSQLAGYTKRDDLAYFLHEVLDAYYVHEISLAPTQDILSAYRSHAIDWPEYARRYTELLESRHVETTLDPALFEVPAALLCSEPMQDKCHRRLAAEYLDRKWGNVRTIPL